MGMFIILTCTFFYIKNSEGSPPFLHGEDFSGFFPEPFPGAITPAAPVIATLTTAIIIPLLPPSP